MVATLVQPPSSSHCSLCACVLFLTGMPTTRCTGATATTTTATDCEWSFPAAAGAREAAASAGLAGRPGADTGLHPDAQSTGSLCQVSITISQSSNKTTNRNRFIFIGLKYSTTSTGLLLEKQTNSCYKLVFNKIV